MILISNSNILLFQDEKKHSEKRFQVPSFAWSESDALLRAGRELQVARPRSCPTAASHELPGATGFHPQRVPCFAMLCHAMRMMPQEKNDRLKKKKDNHDKSEILLINHMLLIFWASNFETVHVGLL